LHVREREREREREKERKKEGAPDAAVDSISSFLVSKREMKRGEDEQTSPEERVKRIR